MSSTVAASEAELEALVALGKPLFGEWPYIITPGNSGYSRFSLSMAVRSMGKVQPFGFISDLASI